MTLPTTYTARARRTLDAARAEAERHNQPLSPERLLLALSQDSYGLATELVARLGLSQERIRETVRARDHEIAQGTTTDAAVAADLDAVLRSAREQAHILGHDYIGVAHILMGLVQHGSTLASALLVSNGATAEQIREWISEFE